MILKISSRGGNRRGQFYRMRMLKIKLIFFILINHGKKKEREMRKVKKWVKLTKGREKKMWNTKRRKEDIAWMKNK